MTGCAITAGQFGAEFIMPTAATAHSTADLCCFDQSEPRCDRLKALLPGRPMACSHESLSHPDPAWAP